MLQRSFAVALLFALAVNTAVAQQQADSSAAGPAASQNETRGRFVAGIGMESLEFSGVHRGISYERGDRIGDLYLTTPPLGPPAEGLVAFSDSR